MRNGTQHLGVLVAGAPAADRRGNASRPVRMGRKSPKRWENAGMLVRDFMTRNVVAVSADTSTHAIARLLLDRGISAVPVVDEVGSPIGMVSEGDLIGRGEVDRQRRRHWWLALFADAEDPEPGILARLRQPPPTAREVMSAPVVTIAETSDAVEAARLLVTHRIKRLPVVRANRVIGILGRADLLRALIAEEMQRRGGEASRHGVFSDILAAIDDHFAHKKDAVAPGIPADNHQGSAEAGVTLADFRGLVADFERHRSEEQAEANRAGMAMRRQRVQDLIDHHVGDENWRTILHRARMAAEHGETELMLLRFPGEMCSDRGRAINAPATNWPETLRGEPAEIYLRWRRDLEPNGFHLAARVLDFPHGLPGDIGLFLVW
ncbi:MAG: CBS domain-containing protein [Stellaceae bacterium]